MSSSDSVCPSCGATTSSSNRNYGSSQQQVSYVKSLSSGHRPVGAAALTGLAVIGAVNAFLSADAYTFIPGVGVLKQFASSFGALTSFMPYFLALVGILSLGAAYGFIKGNHWSWKVGMVTSVLEAITIITPNLLGLAIGVVSLYFLSTRSVKNWLRK